MILFWLKTDNWNTKIPVYSNRVHRGRRAFWPNRKIQKAFRGRFLGIFPADSLCYRIYARCWRGPPRLKARKPFAGWKEQSQSCRLRTEQYFQLPWWKAKDSLWVTLLRFPRNDREQVVLPHKVRHLECGHHSFCDALRASSIRCIIFSFIVKKLNNFMEVTGFCRKLTIIPNQPGSRHNSIVWKNQKRKFWVSKTCFSSSQGFIEKNSPNRSWKPKSFRRILNF